MKRRRRTFWRRVVAVSAALIVVVLGVTVAQVLALRWHDPHSTAWMAMRQRQAAARGEVLTIRHTWVDLAQVPRDLQRAVVLAEDGNFFTHRGFDWEAIRAARARNDREQRVKFGGSTITQQLAKNLYLSPSRTWLRKGREAIITVLMELLLPKERILELYLNSIEMGPGVFGVASGAQHHFAKPVERLTRNESCRLAAIIPSPLRYRPGGAYVGRRAAQLARMLD